MGHILVFHENSVHTKLKPITSKAPKIGHIYCFDEKQKNLKNKKLCNEFSNFENFKLHLIKLRFDDVTLLIKGSRGMALERILDLIQ